VVPEKRVPGQHSGLDARPDFSITSEDTGLNPDSFQDFIECKCTSTIQSKLIRELFGLGYDVSASFAVLASYQRASWSQIIGAGRFGVTALVNPLCDLRREDYLARKLRFFDWVKDEIDRADREKPFFRQEKARWEWVDKKPR